MGNLRSRRSSQSIHDVRNWFFKDSHYLEFLINRLNYNACGSDYPGYCGSSAMILTIFFQRHFKLNAHMVAGWYKPDKSDGHYYTRVTDGKTNYDVCATSEQFTGIDQLVWHETDKGTGGLKFIQEFDDDVLSVDSQEHLDKIGDKIYDNDWETYLDNVIKHCKSFM